MTEVFIICSCIILSAFFSGMEIAYVSSNKVHLSIERNKKNFNSIILNRLLTKPSKFITSMLLGNNIVLVVYGLYSSDLIIDLFADNQIYFSSINQVLIQTTISTVIILITAEFLPKVIFQVYANTLVKFFALPAYIFYLLFYAITFVVLSISNLFLKYFLKSNDDPLVNYISKVELGDYINERIGNGDDGNEIDSEIQIFQNALEFSELKARDVMTPRTEIVGVEVLDPIGSLKSLFIKTGFSKLIVYQDSIDDVLGYVHSFELFKKPMNVRSIMISPEFVPETILIKDLLDLLTKKRKSIAVVLDEYGGTSGIITVEDIIEELFGEIEDEHDLDETLVEEVISDNTYLFSARLDVEHLNQKYQLEIPELESYSTLGGFIVNNTNEIPNKGEKLRIRNYEITIHAASNKKIELVRLTFNQKD